MPMPPKIKKQTYNKEKWGYYGTLGNGANAKVRFLQTVLSVEELDDIKLISDIPGSEKWDVRDLFQRDVDSDRVTKQIIPYFRDTEKVKFFNPLTLIILPIAKNRKEVLKKVQFIEPKDVFDKDFNLTFEEFEKEGYYKFRVASENYDYGQVQWNDHKCFVVAVDGQHRLSGLKRWKNDPAPAEVFEWRIPVVILNIFKIDPKRPTANLLEIVRKIFVYINTTAVEINREREILLNDESVNDICTQEIVQYCHSNDNRSIDQRDESILPLIFFDWRGETKRGKETHRAAPASVKKIREVNDWLNYYILGEDGSDQQEKELNLTDLIPPLESFGENEALNFDDSQRVREQFKKHILPGIMHFLKNLKPYKEYIDDCRKIERESLRDSDLSKHAFMRLRFGSDNSLPSEEKAVLSKFNDIEACFEGVKNKRFSEVFDRDIGMRGIMYAFGASKIEYEEIHESSKDWIEIAKATVNVFNEIIDDGWFKSFLELSKDQRNLLTHVVFDEAGIIINYKLEQAQESLGAFLILLLFKKELDKKNITDDDFQDIWNTYSFNLRKTLERGIRKTVKSELKNQPFNSIKEFNKKVREKSGKETEKQMKIHEKFFGI